MSAKVLNCQSVNYQCGGKCQPKKYNCTNGMSSDMGKITSKFQSIIDKLSDDINKGAKAKKVEEPKPPTQTPPPGELKPVFEDAVRRMPKYSEAEQEDIAGRFKEDKVNPEAQAVLADYTRASYRDINDDLRGKKPTKPDFVPGKGLVDVEFNEKEIAEVREKEKALEYGYNQLKPLEQDEQLYRGSNFPQELLDSIEEGGEWTDLAYGSSSSDKKAAERFTKNVFFIINAKAGSENIKNLGAINTQGEKERLIRKGAKFKIKKVEIVNGVKVVYLEE
jgi:hypothetical protein